MARAKAKSKAKSHKASKPKLVQAPQPVAPEAQVIQPLVAESEPMVAEEPIVQDGPPRNTALTIILSVASLAAFAVAAFALILQKNSTGALQSIPVKQQTIQLSPSDFNGDPRLQGAVQNLLNQQSQPLQQDSSVGNQLQSSDGGGLQSGQ